MAESGKHISRIVTLPKASPISDKGKLVLPLDALIGTVEIKKAKYAVRYCMNEQYWRIIGLYEGYYRDAREHTISKEFRRQILERDSYTCQHCGATEDLTIDHIVPVVKGGQTVKDNLRVLCQMCNSRKGTRESVEVTKLIYLNNSNIRLLRQKIELPDSIRLPLTMLYESESYQRVYIVAGLVLISASYRKKDTPRPVHLITSSKR